MDLFTTRDFRRLAETADPFCVSLLMPSHRTGREVREDPIRFRNLLGEAEGALAAKGRRRPEAREQLEPLRQLSDDTSFWAQQREGLAAYCLPKETLVYGVPFTLRERVMVGGHAYLAPMIPILSENARFYVLALSPKQVRLFEATRHTVGEVELPGWPENFEELAAYIEEEAQLQFHTEAQPAQQMGGRGPERIGGSTDRAGMFHGHPASDESAVRKQRMLEYSRLIDERLHEAVGFDQTPLVLACDERLAPIFREASEYPRIVERPVAGNPDRRRPEELSGEAWEILQPEVDEGRENALSRYEEATGKGMAATRLEAVIPAAHEGRVDTALVAADAERWGRYDPKSRHFDLHDEPDPDDEELVNLAAVASYRQGAALYMLPQDRMPDEQPVVAVLRF